MLWVSASPSPNTSPKGRQALLLIHQFYPARASVNSPTKSLPTHDTSSRKPSWPGCLLYSAPCTASPTQRAPQGCSVPERGDAHLTLAERMQYPQKGSAMGRAERPQLQNAGNHEEARVHVSP